MRLLPLFIVLIAQGVAVDAARSESLRGKATFYWHSQKTANGDRFSPEGMTAAHRTLHNRLHQAGVFHEHGITT